MECESVIKGFYNQLDMDYRDTDSEDEDLGKQQRDSAIPLDVEDEDEEDNGNYRLDNNEDMDIGEQLFSYCYDNCFLYELVLVSDTRYTL